MPASPHDQQPTYILWLVAVVFCQQDYTQAQALVQGGHIRLNGQAVQDPLQVVRSGDIVAWQSASRVMDLDVLKQANALRTQREGFFGGPEALYRRLGGATLPTKPLD